MDIAYLEAHVEGKVYIEIKPLEENSDSQQQMGILKKCFYDLFDSWLLRSLNVSDTLAAKRFEQS